jgi:hypothetical protein
MLPSDEAASRDDAWRHIYFTIVVYTHCVHADSRPALFVDPVFKLMEGIMAKKAKKAKKVAKKKTAKKKK